MVIVVAFSAAGWDSPAAAETIWHIKAIHPEGRFLDVKALDKVGNIYDVKAIEESGNLHLMDIKAFVGGKRLPVKVLVSDDQFAPVKAISPDGHLHDVKGLKMSKEDVELTISGVVVLAHIKALPQVPGLAD